MAKNTRNNTINLHILWIHTFWKVNKFLTLSFVFMKIKNCCHGNHHTFQLFQSGSNRFENLKVFNFDLIVRGEFPGYQFQGRKCNLKRHLENQICKNIRFIWNRAKITATFSGTYVLNIESSENLSPKKEQQILWNVFGFKYYLGVSN